jgi:predicted DNA-binding transcriptional regulator AlpA
LTDLQALLLALGHALLAAAERDGLDSGRRLATAERWIDARRASEISGMSRNWIYEHAHEIPGAIRRGRALRIPELRFRQWMAGRG